MHLSGENIPTTTTLVKASEFDPTLDAEKYQEWVGFVLSCGRGRGKGGGEGTVL